MFPRFSIYDSAHIAFANTETLSQSRRAKFSTIWNKKAPSQSHNVVRDFGILFVSSVLIVCSAFFNTIQNIVSLGSKKQMKWIAARWIVAFMENLKPAIASASQIISDDMRSTHSSPTIRNCPPLSDQTIPEVMLGCANPRPALIHASNFNVRPKILFPHQRIIGILAEIKMRWLAAQYVHTFLTNAIKLRDYSKRQLPSKTMAFFTRSPKCQASTFTITMPASGPNSATRFINEFCPVPEILLFVIRGGTMNDSEGGCN